MFFYEILEEIMNEKHLSIPETARLSGLPDSTIRSMISRKNKTVALEVAFKLANGLDVPIQRLNGEEITVLNTPNNDAIVLSADEKEHIKKYRLINEHSKEIINTILNLEYKQYEATLLEKEKRAAAKSAKKAAPSYIPVQRHYPEGIIPLDSYHESDEYNDKITLPIYDAGASAGTGVFLDSTNYETAAMPNTHLTQRANFAVWVEGDSMEPRFHNGDLVLVRTQPTVDIGEIGIFVVNGEGFIKKLGENKLISLNPEYDDIELNEYDEVYCKGKVLGRAQQILSEGGE